MDKDHDGALAKCSWDGDTTGWNDFVRRVRLLYERTSRKKRRQLGPSIVSQLRGRAWTITQDVDHHRLIRRDGVVYLLEFLRDRLGRTPVPDVGIRLEELMLRLRRAPGTSMSTWASQVRETYKRVQVALSRAREEYQKGRPSPVPEVTGVKPPSSPSSPSSSRKKASSQASPPRRASEATQEKPQAEDAPRPAGEAADREVPAFDPQIPGEAGWKRRAGGKLRADDDDEDSDDSAAALKDLQVWDKYEHGLEEVLPSEVLGWLLLRRANLPSAARLSIQAASGNSLHLQDIERAMRSMEDELMIHDESRGADPFGSRKLENGV